MRQLKFSTRSLLALILVAAVILSALHDPIPNVVYHNDISEWQPRIHRPQDGFYGAISWKKAWSPDTDHVVQYWDMDKDGTVDLRTQHTGRYVIKSFDDDRDGIFDRQTVDHVRYKKPREFAICIAVPRVESNEP